jgi:iron complex outermembrane receptor protein
VAAALAVGWCSLAHAGDGGGNDDDDDALASLDLEQLLALEITGPTLTEEPLAEVPATVIVLDRSDLVERGYVELADMLDDLPGMDVSRGWGDHWYANYVRGHRTIYGSQYLVLVDGLAFNDLMFFDDETTLATFPITAVERVEIVYGPVSAIYGANAVAGVINIVTRQLRDRDGTSVSTRLAGGSLERRVADATVMHRQGALGVRISGRIETGAVDDRTSERYEYTRRQYYLDRRLWGGFVDNPELAGFQSQHHLSGVDARVSFGDVEVGGQMLGLVTGYGVVYAGDRVLNGLEWHSKQRALFATHRVPIGERGAATTTLRWQETQFPSDSSWIDGYQDPVRGRVVGFTYWQSLSDAWSMSHVLTLPLPPDGLELSAGAVYEQKDLAKAYDTTGALADGVEPVGYVDVADVDADTYPYPDAPSPARRPDNRIVTEDLGAFVEATYRPVEAHRLHLGFRLDHDSRFGLAPTLRGGWVGRFGRRVVVRAHYGEAFQEPSPRHLYGGWTGSGSDPTLDPETSRTIEVGGGYTRATIATTGSLYYVQSSGTIEASTTPDIPVARNVADRGFAGLELGVRARFAASPLDELELWAYATRILHNEEIADDDAGNEVSGPIGDLAINKLQAGATARFARHLVATIRGRAIGRRETVRTNPVRAIDRYITADAHLRWSRLGIDGLTLELSVTNLLGTNYFHPGLNDARAGITPGTFAPDGTYTGSGGYYSSLLPQPGTAALLGLSLER